MAADKTQLTPETVAELAPILKGIVEEGRSPAEAFTAHGYSMRVVAPVLASLGRVGAVSVPVAAAEPAGLTAAEVDVEVRRAFGIPTPLEAPAKEA